MVNEKCLSDRFTYFERARRYFCRLCHRAITLIMGVSMRVSTTRRQLQHSEIWSK